MKDYLEYQDEKSHKFWEVSVKGKVMTSRWGKLDTQGQSKSKELASPKLAKAEAEKQKASKIKKGYKAVAAKKKVAPKKKAAAKKKTVSKKKSSAMSSRTNDTDSSSESLRKFLESDDPSLVRMGLSMAKGVGVEEELLPVVLARALFSEEEEVRRAAEDVFAGHAPDELVNLPSALKAKGQDALNALDEVAPEFWHNVLETLGADVRQGIAMLQECWGFGLKILAKDEDEDVRRRVAKNPNTPAAEMEELAKDKYRGVRCTVT